MKKHILIFALVLFTLTVVKAQGKDPYTKPLKEVLKEVETRFNVTIKFDEKMVANRWVTKAPWRFRASVEKTLTNILMPLELSWAKSNGKYKVKDYEPHRWTVEDGKEKLDSLAAKYHDVASWEKRKAELKPCLFEALHLSPLPVRPNSKPILTPLRKFDGYTVQNIGLEVLPGIYVTGSIYRPAVIKGKVPAMLCPNGHWGDGRYRADQQYQCAMLARLGIVAISYDLFAWGESLLQFDGKDHRTTVAMTMQTLNSIRLLDYLSSLKEIDKNRIGVTGGSGGGSLTELLNALDERVKLSVPAVSLSSYFYGGCPCESGLPIHFCGGGTNNDELTAFAAPKPQLVISDGSDWSDHVPDVDLPYLKRIYGFYGKAENVTNVHLPKDGHDYGPTKRFPMYEFVAKHFGLDINKIKDANGRIDESKVKLEPYPALYVFGEKGEKLPKNAVKGIENLKKLLGM